MDLSNIGCGGSVDSFNSSINCVENVPKDIAAFVLSSEKLNAANGKFPTPAEFQAFLYAGKSLFLPVVAAEIPESEKITIPKENSLLRVEEIYEEYVSINARVVHVSNQSLLSFRRNNKRYTTMYLHAIDKIGQVIIGGKDGREVPSFIPHYTKVQNTRAEIPVTFRYLMDDTFDFISDANTDYLDLTNLINIGTVAITNTVGTSGNSFVASGFLGITGWDKIAFPNLYAEITPNAQTLTLYSDVAKLNSVAKVDTAVDNVVDVLNASGFGGTITYAAIVALVLNDTFTVSYSEAV